jgi:hypothetical protein
VGGRSNLGLGIFFLLWLRGPGRHRITLIPLAVGAASRCTCSGAIFFGERRPSGIAGWRKWFIANGGSEGTRDALLPASPVPERRVTVGV